MKQSSLLLNPSEVIIIEWRLRQKQETKKIHFLTKTKSKEIVNINSYARKQPLALKQLVRWILI